MSLMLSKTSDRYNGRRALKKSETRPVLPRHRFVLELHLAGHAVSKSVEGKPSIEELTDYSPAMIYRILASDDAVALKQQIMALYDEEFQALYPEVVDAIRKGLATADKYLDAAKIWLKAHGKFVPERGGDVNVTAEDVVIQILNEAKERK